jgi:putative sterol carrier protein
MADHYIPGVTAKRVSFYFSVGEHRYTVIVDPERCTVEKGNTLERADVVLKTTPELFEKMVIHGKAPGPIDIARGKMKTKDPMALSKLRGMFDFSAL